MSRRLYATLGMWPEADEVSIRRAFKNLCARYALEENPAIANAPELLEEVREAYAVLSHPERRALYDEFGDRSLKKGFDPERERARLEREKAEQARRTKAALVNPTAVQRRDPENPGHDWDLNVAIGPWHARYGGLLVIPVTRPVTCTRCDGSGRRDAPCRTCAGARQVRGKKVEACGACNGLGLTGARYWCGRCDGTGRKRAKLCRRCDGGGEVVHRSECKQCGAKGLRVTFFDQGCGDCGQTGLDACRRCRGNTKVQKAMNFKFYVPRGVSPEVAYRYAGAGFSSHEGAATDLFVRFTVLARAPRRR